jgi:hypothetical protein
MRCTQCDKLVIPQAVGLTEEGRVVFGWCLDCLEEAGCREIEPAPRSRLRPGFHRLVLRDRGVLSRLRAGARRRARRLALERVEPERPASSSPWEQRRQVVIAVAGSLGLWGLVLVASGIFLHWRQQVRAISLLGNGTPALLIGGGGAAAVVGVALWVFSLELKVFGSRHIWKVVQAVGLVVALGVLAEGMLNPLPKRDRAIAAITILALAVSVMARMIEVRSRRRPAAQGHNAL